MDGGRLLCTLGIARLSIKKGALAMRTNQRYRTIILVLAAILCVPATHGQLRFKAKDMLASSDSLVLTRGFTAYLSQVQSADVDTSGKASVWIYAFFSIDPDLVRHNDSVYYVIAQNNVATFDHVSPLGYGPEDIWHPWMNSDSALFVAQQDWGSDIIHRFPSATIKALLLQVPAPPFNCEWEIDYVCQDSTRSVYLDATTGNIIKQSAVVTSAERPVGGLPPVFPELFQNYPNPFNPTTTIRYAIPQRIHVTLSVYNSLGQLVATLVNETKDAGYHDVRFDGSGLASGVYFYRVKVGEYVATKRFLLVR